MDLVPVLGGFASLARIDLGFRAEKLVLGRLILGSSGFPKPHDMAGFLAQMEDRLRKRREITAEGSFPPSHCPATHDS